jgi:hypothetical protein
MQLHFGSSDVPKGTVALFQYQDTKTKHGQYTEQQEIP